MFVSLSCHVLNEADAKIFFAVRGKLVFSLFIVKMNSSMLVEEFPRVNFHLLW